MKFPKWLDVYGDQSFRGDCKSESGEQATFFAWLRHHHPELGAIAIHPKNEGKKTMGQVAFDRSMGQQVGAADVIIPCGFVCEIKRADHTKSHWQKGQQDYLLAAKNAGCFVCLALGADGARSALLAFLQQSARL